MLTRLVTTLTALTLVAISLAVLVPRLGPLTPLQRQIAGCVAHCSWEKLDLNGSRLGDLITALGPPQRASFVDASVSIPYGMPVHYMVEVYYPALSLMIVIEKLDASAHITPGATESIYLATLKSKPLVALPWRGFAGVCRYYPHLIGQCAAS